MFGMWVISFCGITKLSDQILKELGMSKTKLAWRKEVVLKQLMASFHQGASGPNFDHSKLSECKGLRLFIYVPVYLCVCDLPIKH